MRVQSALLVYVVVLAGEGEVVLGLAVVGVDDGVPRDLVDRVAVVGVEVDGDWPAGVVTEAGGNVREMESEMRV